MQMKNIILTSSLLLCNFAQAQDSLYLQSKRFSLHMQETTVSQYRKSFAAPYSGAHSQTTNDEWATTITSTFFASMRPWKNAVICVNPEIAGGHGLSTAFGIAAFTNGEAFRVGNPDPTFYLARAFYRHYIPISSDRIIQEDAENKVLMNLPKNYLSITVGKISIADYFDDNTFSHNARTQFMCWGLMSNAAWDYPANTRGYTPSVLIEFVNETFEARYAFSMMPKNANGNIMDLNINKANANSFELKYKYKIGVQNGKISALAFYNTGFFGKYSASNLVTGLDPNLPGVFKTDYTIVASRQYGRSKYGFGINLEQYIQKNIGVFLKASYNDGNNETWCFTEIDQAASAGISIKGDKWKRKDDTFGLAYCISGISPQHQNYLKNGGLGFMLGDGRLNYAKEQVLESYYAMNLNQGRIIPSLVYQFVLNPGYNHDRGPIHVYSIRVHVNI